MPIFADESSPEDSGTAGDVEVDWEVVCPDTVLVELIRSLPAVPDAMVGAVLVREDALRMPLGVMRTALMVFAVLVGVDAIWVPLGLVLTALMVFAVLVGAYALGMPPGVVLAAPRAAVSGLQY